MPRGKRGTRAASGEPTRQSRRLRVSEEPENASPLQVMVDEPRKRRGRPTKKTSAAKEQEDAPAAVSFETTTSNEAGESVASSADPAEANDDLPPTSQGDIITIDEEDEPEDEVEEMNNNAETPRTGSDIYDGEQQNVFVSAEVDQTGPGAQEPGPPDADVGMDLQLRAALERRRNDLSLDQAMDRANADDGDASQDGIPRPHFTKRQGRDDRLEIIDIPKSEVYRPKLPTETKKALLAYLSPMENLDELPHIFARHKDISETFQDMDGVTHDTWAYYSEDSGYTVVEFTMFKYLMFIANLVANDDILSQTLARNRIYSERQKVENNAQRETIEQLENKVATRSAAKQAQTTDEGKAPALDASKIHTNTFPDHATPRTEMAKNETTTPQTTTLKRSRDASDDDETEHRSRRRNKAPRAPQSNVSLTANYSAEMRRGRGSLHLSGPRIRNSLRGTRARGFEQTVVRAPSLNISNSTSADPHQRAREHKEAINRFAIDNGRQPDDNERAKLPGAPSPSPPPEQAPSAPAPSTPQPSTEDSTHEITSTPGRFSRIFGSISGAVSRISHFTFRSHPPDPPTPSTAPPQASSNPAPQTPSTPSTMPPSQPQTQPVRSSRPHDLPAPVHGSTSQPSQRHAQTPDVAEADEDMDDAFFPSTPDRNNFQVDFTPKSSAGPIRQPGSVAARFKRLKAETKQKAQKQAEKEAAERAAAQQAQEEAQQRNIEQGRIVYEQKMKRMPPPDITHRWFEHVRKTGVKLRTLRKINVDHLAQIPRAPNGAWDASDWYEEDKDGEEYVYIDFQSGDLTLPEDDDIVWLDKTNENTPEAEAERAAEAEKDRKRGEAMGKKREAQTVMEPSTAKRRVRWASDLEAGPTPAPPIWRTNFNSPFTGSMAEADQPLQSALKSATGPSLTSGDASHAQPYLGKLFASSTGGADVGDGNVFGASPLQQSKQTRREDQETAAIAHAKKTGVWTGPKRTAPTQDGCFAVPDDSDDESESDRDNSMMSTTSDSWNRTNAQTSIPSSARALGEESPQRSNIFESGVSAAAGVEPGNYETSTDSSAPPTTPTASKTDADALARARSHAEKHKPKTPSGLRAGTRMSSSPMVPLSGDRDTVSTTPTAPYAQTPTVRTTNVDATPQDAAYAQSVQYAIDLANQIPVDNIPASTFVWPQGREVPGLMLDDPMVTAAINDWKQSDAFEAECTNAWNNAYSTYQREKAAGGTAIAS